MPVPVFGAGAYFHKTQRLAVLGDDIDLAEGVAVVAREDAVAFFFQPRHGLFFPKLSKIKAFVRHSRHWNVRRWINDGPKRRMAALCSSVGNPFAGPNRIPGEIRG